MLREALVESMRWALVMVVLALALVCDPLVEGYQQRRYRLGWRWRHFRKQLGVGAHRIGWWVRHAADRGRGRARTCAGFLRTGCYHIHDWVLARWKTLTGHDG